MNDKRKAECGLIYHMLRDDLAYQTGGTLIMTTELQKHVNSIASDLSDPGLFDRLGEEYQIEEYDILNYLDGVLDIEYIVSGDAEYRGARVMVTCGGPNIWINTRTNMVEGHWWEESASVSYDDAIGLDDTLRDFWDYR